MSKIVYKDSEGEVIAVSGSESPAMYTKGMIGYELDDTRANIILSKLRNNSIKCIGDLF